MSYSAFLIAVLLAIGSNLGIAVEGEVMAPDKALDCLSCHAKLARSTKHEAAVFDCTSCHAPHNQATGKPFRLWKDGNALCFECHSRKVLLEDCFKQPGQQDCGHPVSGHPVERSQDPLYPEKKFGCVSCHNPHSSDMDRLFRYRYTGDKSPYQGNACAVCHWDHLNAPPAPPTPPWKEPGQ